METAKISQKQFGFITNLLAERDYSEQRDIATLSSSEASDLIGKLLNAPRVGQVVEQGMYKLDSGDIFRVQVSRETGNLYAKKLDTVSGGFLYEQGAIRKLRSSDKMTLAEAKAFGVETGLCCVCGAFLTDARSVAEGIGPVCATRVM